MAELFFDENALVRAVERVRGTGEANLLGEAIAQGIGEHLEQYLRTLAREAGQAAPTRDQLAAMAMQGTLAADGEEKWTPDGVAAWAYDVADAMLAERERRLAAPAPLTSTTTETSR